MGAAIDRREFITLAGAAAVCAKTVAAERKSRTGRVLQAGRPVAGAVVSDGLNCVKTDANGIWSLPVRAEAKFVFVTSPSGMRPVGGFYRSLAENPTTLDFELAEWQAGAGGKSTFLHITDTEIGGIGEAERRLADDVKALADQTGSAFVIHTGDICYRAGLENHIKLINDRTLGRPMYYTIGNHDLLADCDYGEQLFESLYGPCWYSFDSGGVHYVVTPMPGGDATPSYTMNDVADWLRNDLSLVKAGTPVVVFNHNLTNEWSERDCARVIGSGEHALHLDQAANCVAFLYGHVHHHYVRRRGSFVTCATSNANFGGIGQCPAAIREVTVGADGKFDSRLHHWPLAIWKRNRAGAVWAARLPGPALFGGVQVQSGRVFVATGDDGNGTGSVNAYSAATGKRLWSVKTGNSINGRMTLAGDKLVAMDLDGRLYAFKFSCGKFAWQTTVPANPCRPYKSGIAYDPVTKLIFAGRGGRQLAAFEGATGKIVWSGVEWKRDSEPCSSVPAVSGGIMVDSAQWSGLHGHNAATGEHLWFRDGSKFFHLGTRPVFADGLLYVLAADTFFELDPTAGETRRELTLEGIGETVTATGTLVTDDAFIFGTRRRGLVAVDRSSFTLKWTMDVGENLVLSAPYGRLHEHSVATEPIALSATIGAIAALDGKIHIFSFADGKVLNVLDTGAPYLSAPAVSGGRLFAADMAGVLRAFELKGLI